MSREVLGKRSRASFSSPSPSRSPTPASKSRRASVALELLSPDPTPNPKRVKTRPTETEDDDGSNKENIPPEPILTFFNTPGDAHGASTDASASTVTMSARELRAYRRASAQATRPSAIRRRRMSRSESTTSVSNRTSLSPPISRRVDQFHAEGAETPSRPLARLSLATPPSTPGSTPPSRVIKDTLATENASLHTLVRSLLHPQATGTGPLFGRERERKEILNFLEPFLAEDPSHGATSLYISGAPGTGKTALINEILASIVPQTVGEADADDASLRALYVNCMSLGVKDGMTGVWEQCLEQLGAEKTQKRRITNKVDWSERFGKLLRGKKCILVLDEIDRLAGSTSISISQIFSLASGPQTHSCLRIIGICNTHTLTNTEPMMHSQTIHFQPYTAAQMKGILCNRLESLPASGFETSTIFPASTIALLAFKVANETGDIRTMLSVARRALDLAAASSQTPSAIAVTPAHVLAALKAFNASINASNSKRDGGEIVTRVRNLGLHSRFALAALLLATKRIASGLSLSVSGPYTSSGSFKENVHRGISAPTIELTTLHGFYVVILSKCGHGAFQAVGRTEFGDLIGLLESSGLVELTQSRGFGSKTKSPSKSKGTQVVTVASGIREEEIVRGLVGSTSCPPADGSSANVREGEVKIVWEKEMRRLEKEMKAKFRESSKNTADFEGALED